MRAGIIPAKEKIVDIKKLVKWINVFVLACVYSLTAINLGLRKGDAGRAGALRPDSPFAAEIEFWFELAVANKEIYDEAAPEIRAALIGALITVAKDTIGGAIRGAKK